MRYAIISDIHSNLAAFQAVLHDIEVNGGLEAIWCLGDIIGYGPEPKACIELLLQYDHICVVGNHDLGALGRIDLRDFNSEAAAACQWTSTQLGSEEINVILNLPLNLHEGHFTLVHGSPRDPIWEYLLSTYNANTNFDHFQTKCCLVGHSHVPVIFEKLTASGHCLLREISLDTPFKLGDNRIIINPGSVGQPRDGDPRASYAIYDSDYHHIVHHRVTYDISVTQQKMRASSLPFRLVSRLTYGY